jgi:Holliday junction resolvase RusA-like endonuclease
MALPRTTLKRLAELKEIDHHRHGLIHTAIDNLQTSLNSKDVDRILGFMLAYETQEILELEKLIVITVPFGARRPRATRRGAGITVYAHPNDTRDKKAFMTLLKEQLSGFDMDFSLVTGEVHCSFEFFVPIDSSFTNAECILAEMRYIRPLRKPDVDNLQKLYLDAMSGVMYQDDIQLVNLGGEKYYSANPRIEMSFSFRETALNLKDF